MTISGMSTLKSFNAVMPLSAGMISKPILRRRIDKYIRNVSLSSTIRILLDRSLIFITLLFRD
jgi:hypothetical protein